VCSQDVGFFLVKINLIRIGNSEPAPLFEIVEKPNDWTKEAKNQAGELTDQQSHRLSFWTAFEEYGHARTDFARLFNPRKPSSDHWHSYSCGSSDKIGVTMTISREMYLEKVVAAKNDGYVLQGHRRAQ